MALAGGPLRGGGAAAALCAESGGGTLLLAADWRAYGDGTCYGTCWVFQRCPIGSRISHDKDLKSQNFFVDLWLWNASICDEVTAWMASWISRWGDGSLKPWDSHCMAPVNNAPMHKQQVLVFVTFVICFKVYIWFDSTILILILLKLLFKINTNTNTHATTHTNTKLIH